MSQEQVPSQSSQGPPLYNVDLTEKKVSSSTSTSTKGQNAHLEHGNVFNDAWALILFVLVFLACLGLSIHGFQSSTGDKLFRVLGHLVGNFDGASWEKMLALIIPFSIVYIGLYLALILKASEYVIPVTLIAKSVILFVIGLEYIGKEYLNSNTGYVFMVFGLLSPVIWYFWRSKIPFAVQMLRTVVEIIISYPGTILVGLGALVVSATCWFMFYGAFISLVELFYDENGSNRGLFFIIILVAFSFTWIHQFIRFAVHVTVSGVFATHYFLAGTANMTKNPTSSSLTRAITKSSGSIAFGALIVAFVETITNSMKESGQQSGSDFVACLACCIGDTIKELFETFNKYAFTQVAIYGKSFCEASKDTWKLVKSHGVEGIINDSIVNSVMTIASLLSAFICFQLSLLITGDLPSQEESFIAFFAALIGLILPMLFFSLIESGQSAIFVALVMDPAALKNSKPELFEKFAQVCPSLRAGHV